jgi:hypothetical protein
MAKLLGTVIPVHMGEYDVQAFLGVVCRKPSDAQSAFDPTRYTFHDRRYWASSDDILSLTQGLLEDGYITRRMAKTVTEWLEDEDTVQEDPHEPNVLSWQERNEFLDTQLGLIREILDVSALFSESSMRRSARLDAYNVYRHLVPFFEAPRQQHFVFDYPPEPSGDQVTITQVIRARGENPSDYDLRQVGSEASRRHFARYGKRPRKEVRWIDGGHKAVNCHNDPAIIDDVLDEMDD